MVLLTQMKSSAGWSIFSNGPSKLPQILNHFNFFNLNLVSFHFLSGNCTNRLVPLWARRYVNIIIQNIVTTCYVLCDVFFYLASHNDKINLVKFYFSIKKTYDRNATLNIMWELWKMEYTSKKILAMPLVSVVSGCVAPLLRSPKLRHPKPNEYFEEEYMKSFYKVKKLLFLVL